MALTPFQRDVCRLLADNRVPRDIDLFHDTEQALAASWGADRDLLEFASRSARYSEAELRGLDFEGEAPDASALACRWRAALEAAREVVGLLPSRAAGRAVLARDGAPYRGSPADLREALAQDALILHEGCIRGAFPRIVR